MEWGYILLSNVIIALVGCVGTLVLTPKFRMVFLSSKLYSNDQNKKSYSYKRYKRRVADGFGIITTAIYLLCLVIFVPFAFMHHNTNIETYFDFVSANSTLIEHSARSDQKKEGHFTAEHLELVYFTAALLSISLMALLGFIGDVVERDLPYKWCLPIIALLPVLIVYYSTAGETTVLLPKVVQIFFPVWYIQLGPLYYVCITTLAIFYVNSIRMLSGLNGLEAGQGLIISLSIIIYNFLGLSGYDSKNHKFSLYLMIPFLTITFGLLRLNWYPAKVFVGDAFCTSAGTVFVIVGIFGHFCESMLMFFIPQLFNFFYSLPQLIGILPRSDDTVPKYSYTTNLLSLNKIKVSSTQISTGAVSVLEMLKRFRLISLDITGVVNVYYEYNNLTMTNFILLFTGPTTEKRLTTIILIIQLLCSIFVLLMYYYIRSIDLVSEIVSATKK